MTRRAVLFAGLVCAVALGGNACSNSYGPDQPNSSMTPVSVQGVKVTPQVIHLVAIGETTQLTVSLFPANATDQAVTWESADTTVATVDAFGRVTAKAVGAGVFITAYSHDGQHQASANVSVNP